MAINPFPPEKRREPSFAAYLQPEEGWITSRVFIDEKKKHQRFYYAAQRRPHRNGVWDIVRYTYSLKDDNLSYENVNSFLSLEESIGSVARNDKYPGWSEPVAHLHGNFRDAAHRQGAYIDDEGNYTALNGGAIRKSTALNRKALNTLYNHAAEKKAAVQTQMTWEEYYREIVNKTDLSLYMGSSARRVEKWMLDCCNTMLLAIDSMNAQIIDVNLPLIDRQRASNAVVCCGLGGKEDHPALVYHYNILRFTALLRAGQTLYTRFINAPMADESLQMLEDVQKRLLRFPQTWLGFEPELTKSLANLITQGPDPYTDKPLPLEKMLRVLNQPPKKDNGPCPGR